MVAGVTLGDAAKLDRDVHVAAQIAAEVDHTHAATPDLADDVVAVSDEPPKPLGRKHHRATLSWPPWQTRSTA